MRRLGGVEDEEKWLAEGIAGIQHNAFFMHRALVTSPDLTIYFSIIDLISLSLRLHRTRTISEKSSSTPLSCYPSSAPPSSLLRDTTISVTTFFFWISRCFVFDRFLTIWFGWFVDMRAFDQLRQLEIFFKDESRHGLPVVDLYELVQHAGNILPRM